MKVVELSDQLTNLSHRGFAQETIVGVIDGVEYKIIKAIEENGEMKLYMVSYDEGDLLC
jgi:hypothetical protein